MDRWIDGGFHPRTHRPLDRKKSATNFSFFDVIAPKYAQQPESLSWRDLLLAYRRTVVSALVSPVRPRASKYLWKLCDNLVYLRTLWLAQSDIFEGVITSWHLSVYRILGFRLMVVRPGRQSKERGTRHIQQFYFFIVSESVFIFVFWNIFVHHRRYPIHLSSGSYGS